MRINNWNIVKRILSKLPKINSKTFKNMTVGKAVSTAGKKGTYLSWSLYFLKASMEHAYASKQTSFAIRRM